jgi:hyaluronan synthase
VASARATRHLARGSGDPAAARDAFSPHLLDESGAAIPERIRHTAFVRLATRAIQLACLVYGAALLYWIWLAKDASLTLLLQDPVFYTYSIVITGYIVARFALAAFYRPTPDTGYRPSVSLIIPAFNEERCIEATLAACYGTSYPADRVEVVVVDDGSTDGTWERILAAREAHPLLVCVQFSHNRGKRAAMAEGIRRSSGEICVFIDSDSVIEPDGLNRLVADLRDPAVGAVVGHAHVLNKAEGAIPKMQQVRYYIAFRVLKGSESLFGAVTCASGCFSGYRRSALLPVLDEWERQTFLRRKATYGDDRALTNAVLRSHRITYQSEAKCHTLVPASLRQFLRQQLRWKKSWLRESLYVVRFIWRKHPVASLLTYISIVFGWVAPVVVFRAVVVHPLAGLGDPWFYVIGVYVIALLGSLYYGVVRRSPLWYHGITFAAMYVALLVWQLYYAVVTLRDTGWGTRDSAHREEEGEVVVVGPAS